MSSKKFSVISIQPQWVDKILSGKKTIELRKAYPERDGQLAFIYSTSPVKAIVGEMHLSHVETLHPSEILAKYPKESCVSRELIDSYYAGKDKAVLLHIRSFIKYKRTFSLHELRERCFFTAPQSYAYASDDLRRYVGKGS